MNYFKKTVCYELFQKTMCYELFQKTVCYELFQKNECIMNCYLKIMYLQIGLPMEENFSSYSVMTLPSISAGSLCRS